MRQFPTLPAPVRVALLLLLMLWAGATAAALQFPALTGRVVDDAGILTPSTRSALDEMLAQHERATGEQVVVVTLKSLGGNSIEDYGYQLGRHWGIGQKDKNTGALLIVAPAERQVRIEVGYGLEGKLTDAVSRVIIEQDILPSFRRGDFNAGVVAGTAAILRVLGGPTAAPAGIAQKVTGAKGVDSGVEILLILAVWIFIFVMFRRTSPRGRLGALPWVMMMGPGFRSYRGPGGMPPGGFGGGFGGFSGGGGSFGGGGASGRW
ncbi:MAG TPA: TPM domain-containing protein [Stellaceae bacterium]|nr:TPM domain-containing protein [Stellaceae bacterium]